MTSDDDQTDRQTDRKEYKKNQIYDTLFCQSLYFSSSSESKE